MVSADDCGEPAAQRAVWVAVDCPHASAHDAIQLAAVEILDTADTLVETGLLRGGFNLLSTPPCEALQIPEHRVAISGYLGRLGIGLVFAKRDAALDLDSLAYFSADASPEDGRPSIDSVSAQRLEACRRRALAAQSGRAGWNGFGALLRPGHDLLPMLARRVMFGKTLALTSTDIEHLSPSELQALASPTALSIHRTHATAQRAPTARLADPPDDAQVAGAAGRLGGAGDASALDGWIKDLDQGSDRSGGVALLFVNHGPVDANLTLPWPLPRGEAAGPRATPLEGVGEGASEGAGGAPADGDQPALLPVRPGASVWAKFAWGEWVRWPGQRGPIAVARDALGAEAAVGSVGETPHVTVRAGDVSLLHFQPEVQPEVARGAAWLEMANDVGWCLPPLLLLALLLLLLRWLGIRRASGRQRGRSRSSHPATLSHDKRKISAEVIFPLHPAPGKLSPAPMLDDQHIGRRGFPYNSSWTDLTTGECHMLHSPSRRANSASAPPTPSTRVLLCTAV